MICFDPPFVKPERISYTKGATKMVRISVEVSSGAARFRVSVQAQSIERALEIVKRQNAGKDCKVRFPIDAEAFFLEEDGVAKMGAVGKVAA
jgi:hypothetical protein